MNITKSPISLSLTNMQGITLNYWLGKKYLGIGPSAHSFDGQNRQFNITNNAKYIAAIQENRLDANEEILSDDQRYNEYVMITLRTKWGARKERIQSIGEQYWLFFEERIKDFVAQSLVISDNNQTFTLTKQGKMLADFIAVELFWE